MSSPSPITSPPAPELPPPPPPSTPPQPPPLISPPAPEFSSPSPLPSTPPPPPPPANTSTPSHTASSGLPPGAIAGLVVGIGIGGSIVLCLVCVWVVFYRRKKRKKAELESGLPPKGPKDDSSTAPSKDKVSNWPTHTPPHGISPGPQPLIIPPTPQQIPPSPSFALGHSLSSFSYEELANATNNFSSSNLLGQGGYGYVHKGVLSNGKVVAVKQLKAGSGQGEREFQAEVEIIGHIHHRHLVSLFGYCISGAQRSLVYEFIPNNTMEFHLHGQEGPTLTWPTRIKIALGSARGLAYLHEDCKPKIIHRDVKASNILIDFNFEAKVADFGLAKLAEDTDTHVSTRVMGTFGYLAPEYASSGKLTEKSDVFSFGVVLLELITGRRPIDKAHPFAEDSMVDWARPLLSQALEDNNFEDLADPRLNNDYDSGEMARMVACAAASIRHSARYRPKMSQIVRALEGNLSLSELNEGIFPYEGVLPGDMRRSSPFGSVDYDTIQYQEDLKKFKKLALETQEMTTTCEFSDLGMQPSTSSSEDPRGAQDVESGNVKNKTQNT